MQRSRIILGLGLTLLAFAGCQSNRQRKLPTMDAVRSRHPIGEEVKRRAAASPNQGAPTLRIYRLDMPIRASTADGWKLINQNAFPGITRTVWRANGMKIGIMDAHRLVKLREKLPRITAVSQAKMAGNSQYTTILSAGALAKAVRIDLTVPPRPPQDKLVRRGQLKLLLRAGRGRSGISIELVPHQHVMKLSLKPRTAQQKLLDGHMFKRLALHAALGSNQMLVVGLDRPWERRPTSSKPRKADKADKAGESSGSNNAGDLARPSQGPAFEAPSASGTRPDARHTNERRRTSSSQPDQAGDVSHTGKSDNAEPANPDKLNTSNSNKLPPIGRHLGRALLTRQRAGHPLQSMLLIGLAPKR